jgi:hypothetical protein
MKISAFLSKHWAIFLFISILLVSTALKILEVKGYNFAFTMDQGRDMTDMRQMIVTHTPRLVGPTTSINGVLLGPFWYYFNLPPFLLFDGNPAAIVYWQIFWFQLSCFLLYSVLKKKSPTLAIFSSALLLLSPFGFNTARYFWNANSMPVFTILFFVTLIWSNSSKYKYSPLLVGLVAGLSMQIEAAFGTLFFPFLIIYYLLSRQKIKKIFLSGVGFFVTLIPQIIFEVRHGFLMTKIFLAEFTGKGNMLGAKTTISDRLIQRGDHLLNIVRQTNHLNDKTVIVFTALAFIIFLYLLLSKKISDSLKEFSKITLIFISFAAIFYLAFPEMLKIWYTLGFSVPVVFVDALFLECLFHSKNIFLKFFPFLFVIYSLVFCLFSQTDYLKHVSQLSSNDPSNLQNEIADLNWVYQQAAGQGFNLYSYIPSVYDYPNQHVFWWYGTQKYGYQPADISYLPNQPEYIKDESLAWTKKRPVSANQLTFLIIETDKEMPSREQVWLGHFAGLCTVKQQSFPWHAEVRMLSKCTK